MSEPAAPQIEMYLDGSCRLCRGQAAALQRRDRRGRLRFVNMAAPGFQPPPGVTLEAMMDRVHARLPDGRWVAGVEVFREAYTALGFGPLVTLSRLPGVRQALDVGYRWLAKNRHRFGGSCADGACQVGE